MGLSVSHGAWSGSCSYFNEWRRWLAGRVGVPLMAMEGFCDEFRAAHTNRYTGKADSWTYEPLPWDMLRPDPLHVLLNHSDCDGSISVHDLPPLEMRLREVASECPSSADAEDWIDAAYRFADGCARAIDAGEDLLFS